MKADFVFDFGGVLLRWQPTLLLQQCLPQHAPDEASAKRLAEALFQSFVPGSHWAEFDRGALTVDELAPRLAQRSGLSVDEVQQVITAIPPHLEPKADTLALLLALKQAGHRLFFLSNMPAPYAEHLNSTCAFPHWFDDGIYSCQLGLVKPEPAIFRAADERFKLKPGNTIFIDDHPSNVEQARACGWHALQFTSAAGCIDSLAGLGIRVASAGS